MTAFLRAFAVGLLLGVNARASEHAWPVGAHARDAEERVSLSVSARAGLVESPFVTTAFPEVSGFGLVLTGSAAMRLLPATWVHARLPVSIVRLDFPAGAQVSESALGNLELGLGHRLELRAPTHLVFSGAVLVPTAQDGSPTALLDNRALAVGNALNGGKDAALLTPGVSGVRFGGSLEHTAPPFELRASLDVPVLVRVSDASLPDETETHPIGIAPLLDLRAAFWMSNVIGASMGVVGIAEAVRVQEPALEHDRERRFQLVIEPAFHLRLGGRVALGLGGSVPVGGSLGGDAWSIGIQGRLGL